MGIRILALPGLPEIRPGDPIGALIRQAAVAANISITHETVLVVAQKIVSKAEGALVDLATVEPSARALEWAGRWGKDPRLIEVILGQARRIVRMERGVLIAETRHGFVAANAGVDQSDVPGHDLVSVLPADPDASARRLRGELECGAVIISDTFGRPWRLGLVNVAIGVDGLEPLEDYRGRPDRFGRRLQATVVALADELAAAAGLVMRKAEGVPVALIEGLRWKPSAAGARSLIRPPEEDLFR